MGQVARIIAQECEFADIEIEQGNNTKRLLRPKWDLQTVATPARLWESINGAGYDPTGVVLRKAHVGCEPV